MQSPKKKENYADLWYHAYFMYLYKETSLELHWLKCFWTESFFSHCTLWPVKSFFIIIIIPMVYVTDKLIVMFHVTKVKCKYADGSQLCVRPLRGSII